MSIKEKTLHYLFDPLCGWCYGASAFMGKAQSEPGLTLSLWPTGLFSGLGARAMDTEFAAYAWSNDQRIEQLTGQCFTEAYRRQVLEAGGMFDSGAATLALQAVHQSAPERELEALKAIQLARYVDGRDITRTGSLVSLLGELGLEPAATALAEPDLTLVQALQARTQHARRLMQAAHARGVPTLLLEVNETMQLLPSTAVYGSPDELLAQIRAL
ncbi:MAG: hypothetical protein KER_02917 [Kerstersia gyiorum]|uniref:DsbA family protein n=1 Tax=Kerstersia gyiorum TaxID=206506 RepID=UPI0030CACE70